MAAVFPLAPMTRDFRGLTWVALVLPLALAGAAVASPSHVRLAVMIPAAVAVLVFIAIWLFFRPTRFVVDDHTLRIEWPMRARRIPRAAVESAQIIDRADFVRANGRGVRVGAGGLWGTFGLLSADRETFSIWVSRTDQYVLVRLRGGDHPLLLTPDDAPAFVAALGAPASRVASGPNP